MNYFKYHDRYLFDFLVYLRLGFNPKLQMKLYDTSPIVLHLHYPSHIIDNIQIHSTLVILIIHLLNFYDAIKEFINKKNIQVISNLIQK